MYRLVSVPLYLLSRQGSRQLRGLGEGSVYQMGSEAGLQPKFNLVPWVSTGPFFVSRSDQLMVTAEVEFSRHDVNIMLSTCSKIQSCKRDMDEKYA